MPSPPTTTRLSTPSATQRWARSSVSSASRPARLRTWNPASRSRGSAIAAVRVPRPLPEVGFVRSAISLATRRAYAAVGRRYVATLGSRARTSVTP